MGTFGNLLENVSKIIYKGAKFYQKSPKGDPKVEEGSSKTVLRTPPPGRLLSKIGFVFFYKNMLKLELTIEPNFVPQV